MASLQIALAQEINEQHRLAVASYSGALEHALRCGELLVKAKHGVAHGEWLEWLDGNFDGSVRIAQRYMQLADAPELNTSDQTHLESIGGALRQISKPRAPKATAAAATELLQGLRGADAVPAILAPGDTAINHHQAEAMGLERDGAWAAQQHRKRHKAIDLLEETRAKLDDAGDERLSAFSVAAILREAAVRARQAASELDALAFSFEQ